MLKNKILNLLAENPEDYLSGEGMAQRLGVSRNAVWKAIKRLQTEGIEIEAAARQGYRLAPQSDILSAERVKGFLPASFPGQLEYHPSIDSTNNRAKASAEEGAPGGLIILANAQTKGRGRLGRGYHSPEDAGVYLSILLRPEYDAKDAGLLTLAAATAVAEAVEGLGVGRVGIKWVNDCFLGERKIAGILTEAAISMEDQSLRYAVVGIGINVYAPVAGYPKELQDIAGAVFPVEKRRQDLRARLAADVLTRFFAYAMDLPGRGFLEGYRNRLNMIHRPVRLIRGNQEEIVIPVGVDDAGYLLVQDSEGKPRTVHSGEVRLRL